LERVEAELAHPVSNLVQIDTLTARLRLYAKVLLSRRPSEVDRHRDILISGLWQRGFHTATQIAHIFARCSQREFPIPSCGNDQRSPQEADKICLSSPKSYFRALVSTGFFLIHFMAQGHDISRQDRILARNWIKQVYECLQYLSHSKIDEGGRAARLLELLSRHVDDGNSSQHFKKEDQEPSRTMLESAMVVTSKLRLNLSQSADQELRQQHAQLLEPKSSELTSAIGSQDEQTPLSSEDLSAGWESWLSDTGDIMGPLPWQSNHFSLDLM
jgi:hypothetical protein